MAAESWGGVRRGLSLRIKEDVFTCTACIRGGPDLSCSCVALVHLPLAFPAAQLISQLAPRAIAGRGAGARKASQPPPGGSTSPKVHCTVTVLLYCRYRRARVPVALRGSGSGWRGCYGVGGDVSLQFAPLQISIVYAYGAGTHSHTVASPRISILCTCGKHPRAAPAGWVCGG